MADFSTMGFSRIKEEDRGYKIQIHSNKNPEKVLFIIGAHSSQLM
jgi:hypothetical protein